MINSVFRTGKNYYAQALLKKNANVKKNVNMFLKKKKIRQYIIDKISSDFDRENSDEENSNEENFDKENLKKTN